MAFESGSYCYLAPEYGYSKKATEQMDAYSFGVVLLELISGRQAAQSESGETIDIVKWVRRKVNMADGAIQVPDHRVSNTSQHEMWGALDVALHYTSVMPEKRPKSLRLLDHFSPLTPKPDLVLSFLLVLSSAPLMSIQNQAELKQNDFLSSYSHF